MRVRRDELVQVGTLRGVTQHLADVLGREASADAAVIELAAERPGSSEQHRHAGRYPETTPAVGDHRDSCNLPGVQDHWSFWENLRNGKETAEFLSEEELRTRGVSPELIGQADYVPARYSIAGKELFDAGFFKFSPKDAELMDPQLRLLLQRAWKAVEDAGYVARDIADTSVFISSSNSAYQALAAAASTSPSDDYLAWLLAQSGTIPTLISPARLARRELCDPLELLVLTDRVACSPAGDPFGAVEVCAGWRLDAVSVREHGLCAPGRNELLERRTCQSLRCGGRRDGGR